MYKFHNILFYSVDRDQDRYTFEKILKLSQIHNAKLTLVEVLEPAPSKLERLFSSSVRTDLNEILQVEANKRLEQLAEKARDLGVDTNTDVLYGKPFIELIRSSIKRNCDLIVKTAQGLGDFKERLLGTTALHLVRKSPVPVLVVEPRRHAEFTRILVPLDSSSDDALAQSLNMSIVDNAISMATDDNAELHLLHAWKPYGMETLTLGRFRVPPEKTLEYVASYKREQKALFEDFLKQCELDHVNHRVHFVRGDAANTITSMAVEKEIDLIVMGSANSAGLGGVFIGSTAEQVLSVVKCSILAVKPEGFVTPVN